jgi:hypothetical protein
VVFVLVTAAVLARNLVALGSSPPGLYADEASIGYNAWTIAHYGVDEHGAVFPLYFQAFGEWKNPVYIYLLAPCVWLFGLSPAVIRLPAALLGVVTMIALAGFAWHVTRSHLIALISGIPASARVRPRDLLVLASGVKPPPNSVSVFSQSVSRVSHGGNGTETVVPAMAEVIDLRAGDGSHGSARRAAG